MSASILPDEKVFSDFRKQCQSTENWQSQYEKDGIMQVWVEKPPVKTNNNGSRVHAIRVRMFIKDVSAATMYDVLHDGEYRKEWDKTMSESYDIARLSKNADVGYYAWICPKPLKNRDVVTLRSWQVNDDEYTIVNFSVKHPNYPPRSHLVRAISIQTGYYIKSLGPDSCIFTYLSQADPKGALPKWIVNKASKVLAPKVMKSVHKAGQNYVSWKRDNRPEHKPWLFPDQNTLPEMSPADLSIQRAESLENIDESSKIDTQDSEDSC